MQGGRDIAVTILILASRLSMHSAVSVGKGLPVELRSALHKT
jgi:hypothetical protein